MPGNFLWLPSGNSTLLLKMAIYTWFTSKNGGVPVRKLFVFSTSGTSYFSRAGGSFSTPDVFGPGKPRHLGLSYWPPADIDAPNMSRGQRDPPESQLTMENVPKKYAQTIASWWILCQIQLKQMWRSSWCEEPPENISQWYPTWIHLMGIFFDEQKGVLRCS